MRHLFKNIIIAIVLLASLAPAVSAQAEGNDSGYTLGLIPSPAGDYPTASVAVNAALPAYADLSSGMPPIGYQGKQASCVGWALAYYYRSYQEGVENSTRPSSNSQIFSPAYVYNQRSTADCSRDTGMSLLSGLQIAVNQGIATLATMPYKSSDTCTQPSEAAQLEASYYRAASYTNVFLGAGTASLALVKQYLATGTPVLLGVPVYDSFYKASPANPVIGLPDAGAVMRGGHAVTLVGYDDARGVFKFVNSWGSWWGESGYGYLTYEYVQQKAWEGWVLRDADTTPPSLPQQAQELQGAQSGVIQSAVSGPVFSWERGNDSSAVYQVYWGTQAEGTDTLTTNEPTFTPAAITENGTYYLRVQARDAAGNTSGWSTLFVFCYEKAEEIVKAFQHPIDQRFTGLLRLAPVVGQ